MDRQTKTGIATGLGGMALGGFIFAADKLQWDFPPMLMYILAGVSVIGLFASGAIWIHLIHERFTERWGKSMMGQLIICGLGIFFAAGGSFFAWQGGARALALYRSPAIDAKKTIPAVFADAQVNAAEAHRRGQGMGKSQKSASAPIPSSSPLNNPAVHGPRLEATPAPALDNAEAQATIRGLWNAWLLRDGLTTEEMSGLVLPPDDWMNSRLTKMGRNYRVRAKGAQFEISAVTPEQTKNDQ